MKYVTGLILILVVGAVYAELTYHDATVLYCHDNGTIVLPEDTTQAIQYMGSELQLWNVPGRKRPKRNVIEALIVDTNSADRLADIEFVEETQRMRSARTARALRELCIENGLFTRASFRAKVKSLPR